MTRLRCSLTPTLVSHPFQLLETKEHGEVQVAHHGRVFASRAVADPLVKASKYKVREGPWMSLDSMAPAVALVGLKLEP